LAGLPEDRPGDCEGGTILSAGAPLRAGFAGSMGAHWFEWTRKPKEAIFFFAFNY
jgi:hypothetical protein